MARTPGADRATRADDMSSDEDDVSFGLGAKMETTNKRGTPVFFFAKIKVSVRYFSCNIASMLTSRVRSSALQLNDYLIAQAIDSNEHTLCCDFKRTAHTNVLPWLVVYELGQP